jgi:site-specific DNA-methyltransferase (cytosine-N4-specific)
LVPTIIAGSSTGLHNLPEFFIKFLTDPGDLVVDPFAGSNVTGEVAEGLERYWLAFELVEEYLEGSKFRFPDLYEQSPLFATRVEAAEAVEEGLANNVKVDEGVSQPTLLEPKARYKAKRKRESRR